MIENKIINVNFSELKADPDNPNEMTEKQINGLKKSMEVYGYLFPIIIDQNNMIIDGHHRAMVYKEFGNEQIPCIKIEFENDAQRRSLRQSVNKLHGTHDPKKDLIELEKIISQEPELISELIDFTQKDLEDLKKAVEIISPEFRRKPRSKEDFFEDGKEAMDKIGMKKLITFEVDDEIYDNLKGIMEIEDLKDYKSVVVFLIERYYEGVANT